MKILLIHPQNYLQRISTGIYGRSLRYAPLTMPTLKALIPEDIKVEVKIIDEMVEPVDYNPDVDLVGITATTGTAARAYTIADRFRQQGTTVVLGGIHPTLMTDEALLHADVVIKGYAERTWPIFLRDFKQGKFQNIYDDPKPFRPSLIVAPDRTSIHKRDYFGWCTVEMSRGCANNCDFCISHRFHRAYICRDIDAVIQEIKTLSGKIIFFLDPNLICDKEHSREFFSRLIGLNKWWVGCASLDIIDDPVLLKLMAKSGCKGLLMGFESFYQDALNGSSKMNNIGKNYAEVVTILHDHGISVQACFVFGFDSDTPDVFKKTADDIINAKFDLPQISIYTPFPGTPVFDQYEKQGRILTRNWSLYNGQNVVFTPGNMSVRELEEGADYVRKKVYSWRALSSRLLERPLWIKPIVFMSYIGFRFYQYRIARTGVSDRD